MISTAKSTLVPAGTWTVDPAHSTVGFAVKHLGIATVRGKFDEFQGTLEIGEHDESARAYAPENVPATTLQPSEPAPATSGGRWPSTTSRRVPTER